MHVASSCANTRRNLAACYHSIWHNPTYVTLILPPNDLMVSTNYYELGHVITPRQTLVFPHVDLWKLSLLKIKNTKRMIETKTHTHTYMKSHRLREKYKKWHRYKDYYFGAAVTQHGTLSIHIQAWGSTTMQNWISISHTMYSL